MTSNKRSDHGYTQTILKKDFNKLEVSYPIHFKIRIYFDERF